MRRRKERKIEGEKGKRKRGKERNDGILETPYTSWWNKIKLMVTLLDSPPLCCINIHNIHALSDFYISACTLSLSSSFHFSLSNDDKD